MQGRCSIHKAKQDAVLGMERNIWNVTLRERDSFPNWKDEVGTSDPPASQAKMSLPPFPAIASISSPVRALLINSNVLVSGNQLSLQVSSCLVLAKQFSSNEWTDVPNLGFGSTGSTPFSAKAVARKMLVRFGLLKSTF